MDARDLLYNEDEFSAGADLLGADLDATFEDFDAVADAEGVEDEFAVFFS